MPAVNKEGTQLLVSPHVKITAQALAIARQESTAEVYRVALEPALSDMLRHNDTAQRLLQVLDGMKVDQGRALQAMIAQKIRYADLFLADGSPRARFPGRI